MADSPDDLGVRRRVPAGQAGAHKAVEGVRVEVAVELRADVTHVGPLALDADGIRRERRRGPDGRAHLPAMCGVEGREVTVGGAGAGGGIATLGYRTARIDGPAAGHAAAGHAGRRR